MFSQSLKLFNQKIQQGKERGKRVLTLFAFFNKSSRLCQESVYRDVWFSWDSWPFSVTYTHLTLKGSFHPQLKIPACEEIPYYVTYRSSAYIEALTFCGQTGHRHSGNVLWANFTSKIWSHEWWGGSQDMYSFPF